MRAQLCRGESALAGFSEILISPAGRWFGRSRLTCNHICARDRGQASKYGGLRNCGLVIADVRSGKRHWALGTGVTRLTSEEGYSGNRQRASEEAERRSDTETQRDRVLGKQNPICSPRSLWLCGDAFAVFASFAAETRARTRTSLATKDL